MSNEGMFWHVHHDVLVEWSDDIRERIAYIKKEKPENEVPTRLRLMKKVKGKLPKEYEKAYPKLKEADQKRSEACDKLVKAYHKLEKAYPKWKEAYQKLGEADQKWNEACHKLKEAYQKLEEAYQKFKPVIEKLHKKECGCTEWNGKEIIFKEKRK